MIKPNHQCSWFGERTTRLAYREGRFQTGGTSLPVLFDAFRGQSLRWFSLLYGDCHSGVPENLALVAVNGDLPPVPGQEPHAPNGPLRAGVPDSASIEEYVLSEDMRAVLKVDMEDGHYYPTDWRKLRYSIRLHDDCFGSIEPIDGDLLRRLVHGTLKLHSYYLGQDVDWEPSLDKLSALLEKIEQFDFRFDPNTSTVYVEWPRTAVYLMRGLPVKAPHGLIVIRDGKASFNLADGSIPD